MPSRIYLLTESWFCETWSGLRSEGLKSFPLSWAGAGSIRGSAQRLLTQWLTPWNRRWRAKPTLATASTQFLRCGFFSVCCVCVRACVLTERHGVGDYRVQPLSLLSPRILYLYPQRSNPHPPPPKLLLSFTCCLKQNRPDTTVMVDWAEKRSYLLIVAKMSRQEWITTAFRLKSLSLCTTAHTKQPPTPTQAKAFSLSSRQGGCQQCASAPISSGDRKDTTRTLCRLILPGPQMWTDPPPPPSRLSVSLSGGLD